MGALVLGACFFFVRDTTFLTVGWGPNIQLPFQLLPSAKVRKRSTLSIAQSLV